MVPYHGDSIICSKFRSANNNENIISPLNCGDRVTRHMMIMWLKGENCTEQLRELYIHRMTTYKENNRFIKFHAKSMAAWS